MSSSKKIQMAPAKMRCISVSIAVMIVVAFLFPVPGRGASESPAKPTAANRVDYLPSMSLLDQNGRTVSLASLKGRPVLVSFIHASCQGACQMMTAKMKMVAQSLGSKFDSRVTMVSITTDPEHDRPRQLLAYAKQEGANTAGWVFLTGKPQVVGRVLALYNIPLEASDASMAHVFDLFLVGPDGLEVRQYHGMKVAPDIVASDIRKTPALNSRWPRSGTD